MRRIDRWFPDRQVLIRGPDKISALMISQRQQVCGVAAAAVCTAWLVGATVGIAASYRTESKAAFNERRLELAQAANQATIERVSAECVRLADERDLAVAQADKIRDLAVAQADKVRDDAVARADQLRDQAVAQARLAVAANSEITEQLIRQTQATIGHVETIIKSTGLDPDQLARLPGPDREAGAPDAAPLASLTAKTPGLSAADSSRSNILSQEISRLQSLGNLLQQMPLIAPVAEVSISSPFGYRPDPWTGAREFHVGIDIRGAIGSPVYATAPGVVTFAGVSTGYGNLVVIDHGYGLTTRYSHLQKILVSMGTAVTEHQEIGLLGNTGWSTGPHLLYETRVDGQPQNPLNFIKATP
jgi:murein DD-endopeptidase MepM/ murein hydrolase activator NlpD